MAVCRTPVFHDNYTNILDPTIQKLKVIQTVNTSDFPQLTGPDIPKLHVTVSSPIDPVRPVILDSRITLIFLTLVLSWSEIRYKFPSAVLIAFITGNFIAPPTKKMSRH